MDPWGRIAEINKALDRVKAGIDDPMISRESTDEAVDKLIALIEQLRGEL